MSIPLVAPAPNGAAAPAPTASSSPAPPTTTSAPGDSSPAEPGFLWKLKTRVSNAHQLFLDQSTPYVTQRWLATLLLGFLYTLRIVLGQGWYLITYGLGIYILNMFIAFLSPKMNTNRPLSRYNFDEEDDDGPALPTDSSEEFRPFIRRLPEFKFWLSTTRAILFCLFLTLFQVFNIPVFWPILVMYFIILFCATMKRQIKHMIRYRYLPFTYGKTKYQGKEDTGDVVTT